jgi:hypothetical protein
MGQPALDVRTVGIAPETVTRLVRRAVERPRMYAGGSRLLTPAEIETVRQRIEGGEFERPEVIDATVEALHPVVCGGTPRYYMDERLMVG